MQKLLFELFIDSTCLLCPGASWLYMYVEGMNTNYKKKCLVPFGNCSILETTKGNIKVKSSICKLCENVKITHAGGTNVLFLY